MKSNYFGPVILKKLKSFERLDKRSIKCKKHVTINSPKGTSLLPNLGVAASLKSKADAFFG